MLLPLQKHKHVSPTTPRRRPLCTSSSMANVALGRAQMTFQLGFQKLCTLLGRGRSSVGSRSVCGDQLLIGPIFICVNLEFVGH